MAPNNIEPDVLETSFNENDDPPYPGNDHRVTRRATYVPESEGPSGVTYSWHNLNVFAETKSTFGKKISEYHILKDVSGLCKPGQLLAIMGASGAGKTTLLNVLTYRSINLKIKGAIHINGQPVDPKTLMGVSAYVQQVDLFTRVFTVREQLNFHSQLRIGRNVSTEERRRRVKQVLRDLGMNKCADTLIGEPGRIKGISGGEKKRLAFACELITNPLLLLCDEPTSGLDSFMAQSVVNIMKQMTLAGKTVISTIHQPSSEVFAMFDRLLILGEGRVAFIGDAQDAMTFFTRLDRPCPQDFNPGDHYIHTLGVHGGREDECRTYIHSVCDEFRDNEGRAIEAEVIRCKSPPEGENALSHLKLSKSPYRANTFNQYSALFVRAWYEIIREPFVTFVKFAQSMFFAIVFGLIYFDLDTDDKADILNICAVLFVFVTNVSFVTLFPVVIAFAEEKSLFLREHWNGLYRVDAYFMTKNIVELPIYIIVPIIFNAVSYYMVGLRDGAEYFFSSTVIMVLIANTAVSYGYMISCLADDYNTALTLSTPLTFPLLLFGGFYVQADTIPVYLEWLKYLSWFYFGFEGLMINQWDGFTETVPGENGTMIVVPVGKYVLENFGFEDREIGRDYGAMFGLFIGYRLVAYLLLIYQARRKA